MRLNKLIKIIDGKYINNFRNKNNINRFEFNTKNIHKNDVFISINDGYKYLKDDDEIICIITDKVIKNINKPVILVSNVYEALNKIAIYKRKKYKDTKVIAITGSVGKTTTKEMLYNVLKTKYKVTKSPKNFNNYIGVPYTLANIDDKYDYIILELGMNHSNELSKLTKICQPNISVITNIGTSHIGNFNSYEDLTKAKLEITNHLYGPLFIEKKYNKYTKHRNIINYQKYNIEYQEMDIDKTLFKIEINKTKYQISLNIPGIHLIDNIINVINISEYLDIDVNDIIKEINNFKMPDNRIEIIKNDNIIINDTYNASKESLIGILESIKDINKDKILILGDILELGKYSKSIHKEINEYLKNINIKKLLVGDETKVIEGIHFSSNSEVIDYLRKEKLKDKLILIKGSHAMKLNEIVDFLAS